METKDLFRQNPVFSCMAEHEQDSFTGTSTPAPISQRANTFHMREISGRTCFFLSKGTVTAVKESLRRAQFCCHIIQARGCLLGRVILSS